MASAEEVRSLSAALTGVICAILLWTAAGVTRSAGGTVTRPTPSRAEAAERIKSVYTSGLANLSPEPRAHFAIRMYRVTGDTAYVKHIVPYASLVAKEIRQHMLLWDSAEYRESTARAILAELPDSPKNRRRADILMENPDVVFYSEVLERFYQMKCIGLEGEVGPDPDRVLQRLASEEWEKDLSNPDLVREYASQLANWTYYLKFLGVVDLEETFTRAFRSVFMGEDDRKLDDLAYQNKIYGMTHFILAGSGYLQQYVDPEKYAWILDDFDSQIERICDRAKPDVIAEVGLCFKLCGRKDHRVVAMTQQRLLEVFDPKRGIIPPPGGVKKVDLDRSEHRNIIAYLLLADFERLYPGPRMRAIPRDE